MTEAGPVVGGVPPALAGVDALVRPGKQDGARQMIKLLALGKKILLASEF